MVTVSHGPRQSLETITRRYDRLARFYRALEPLYLIHDGVRRKAVQALDLSPGDTVLEIGCGTGRNLAHLLDAVGEQGTVIGIDASAGMLAEAHKLAAQRRWSNVRLLKQDAAQLSVEADLDGVLFSLSYSVMDAGLPETMLGRILRPAARALINLAPGDPYSRPWEDLATLAPVSSRRFLASLYYVCFITKPSATSSGQSAT
jgi:ubiquinone/menaquinone biosynthesis C-methylase UbiE